MRYSLRTLVLMVALGPPILSGAWSVYRDYRERVERERERDFILAQILHETTSRKIWQGSLLDDLVAAEATRTVPEDSP